MSKLASVPGPNPTFTIPGYHVRKVQLGDLKAIEAIAAEENFDVGLHNIQLYFEMSPNDWHVAVEDKTNEIVAFDSYTKICHDCYMG
jgi:hypothetical protein